MSGLKNIFKKFLDLINLANFRYDKNHTVTLKIIPQKMQLKTLFLSSKTAESMTAIPALPFLFNELGKDK